MNFEKTQFGSDWDEAVEQVKDVSEIAKNIIDTSKPIVIEKTLKNYGYGALALGLLFKSRLFALAGVAFLWADQQKKKDLSA